MIEPQGQIIYVSYNEGDIGEPNGTRVTGADSNGLITRLGVRFQRMFQHDTAGRYSPMQRSTGGIRRQTAASRSIRYRLAVSTRRTGMSSSWA
ncbi:hypothetical protein BZM27_41225 [Paraburkholderia steynii]|uniref:Autotransporter domain-containing protein n=1 Tax=Paraburkholderia steynii TaxID=1245441 RepID=A0A4V6N9D4_9BURK|nr:hypothetical protein BZM27_41225 [Paraburkholderia steynii]